MNLCGYHRQVIHDLEHKDHVGDRDSERVAAALARQCPDCEEKA